MGMRRNNFWNPSRYYAYHSSICRPGIGSVSHMQYVQLTSFEYPCSELKM